MSYMFEKNYDDSTDDQGEASLEPLGSAIDPPYHDYLATRCS